MTVVFTSSNSAISAQPIDLIQSAYQELGINPIEEPVTRGNAAWGLEKLQRLIDNLNAQREMIFSLSFQLFNLTANHAPHTIGPAGDFQAPYRPVQVVSASFILNSGSANPVDTPIRIRDADWWAANPIKSLTSSIVTDLYYDPASPLGNLNFYPISNINNPVRLELWNSLTQALDLVTPLGFVQGYWDLIVTNLALSLAPSFNIQPSPYLAKMANDAIETVMDNNNKAPRIVTNSGMPGSPGDGRPDYNFLTGLRE